MRCGKQVQEATDGERNASSYTVKNDPGALVARDLPEAPRQSGPKATPAD